MSRRSSNLLLLAVLAFLTALTGLAAPDAHARTAERLGEICLDHKSCKDGKFCNKPDGGCGPQVRGRCTDRPAQCPALFAPEWVCGCDGETYSSPCEANQAGTSVAAQGKCVRRCRSNAACGAGELCSRDPGQCRTLGVCRERPQTCPALFAPEWVCGCDGKTYSSPCEAAQAGVSIAAEGKCARSCGPGTRCDSGDFCFQAAGKCGSAGVCRERPQACTQQYDPVCGCDGKTYSNPCYAWRAGTSVASEGECQTPCRTNGECQNGELCLKEPGQCLSIGSCQARPEACTHLWDPVCGCDGRTYSNPCAARRAKVSIAAEGECQRPCRSNGSCQNDELCLKPPGQCQGSGLCQDKPTACPRNYNPVCGCDRKTYSNECGARRAGVSVRSQGKCPELGLAQ